MNLKPFILSAVMLYMSCAQTPDNVRKNDYLRILNTNIYYEEHGNGVPILLLSGGGLSRSVRDFDSIIPLLSTKYRVIVPDSPGQGLSDQPDSLSYSLLAEYFSQFIDSLKLDSVYIMGWSDGGITALLLGEKRADKVKKVIAVGANYSLSGALPKDIDITTVKPMALDAWGANNKDVVERYKKRSGRDWKKMMTELNAMWYAHDYFPKSILTGISIPTLIVLGDRDDIVVEHGLDMQRLIKNSQLCVLPNTTHEVFAERSEVMSKVTLDFLEEEAQLTGR